MDDEDPEEGGDLGGEMDDILAELYGGGVGHVLPDCLLCRSSYRAEQSDLGVVSDFAGTAGQGY